jgi:hypothetical protein
MLGDRVPGGGAGASLTVDDVAGNRDHADAAAARRGIGRDPLVELDRLEAAGKSSSSLPPPSSASRLP